MEHIPAIHAAKVGMRYPAQVTAVAGGGLFVRLDLTGLAPGRAPRLTAFLQFERTLLPNAARELRLTQRVEVVLIDLGQQGSCFIVALPADGGWLAWNNGTVPQLARRIRETGEYDLLPVLADALEEAGCTDRGTLTRCRRPADDDLRWLVELLATQE